MTPLWLNSGEELQSGVPLTVYLLVWYLLCSRMGFLVIFSPLNTHCDIRAWDVRDFPLRRPTLAGRGTSLPIPCPFLVTQTTEPHLAMIPTWCLSFTSSKMEGNGGFPSISYVKIWLLIQLIANHLINGWPSGSIPLPDRIGLRVPIPFEKNRNGSG